jgi:hypothetical protein
MCGRGRRVGFYGSGGDGGSGGSDEALEKFDFIVGCFGVSGGGLDDFESDVSVHSGHTRAQLGVGVGMYLIITHFSSLAIHTVEK